MLLNVMLDIQGNKKYNVYKVLTKKKYLRHGVTSKNPLKYIKENTIGLGGDPMLLNIMLGI